MWRWFSLAAGGKLGKMDAMLMITCAAASTLANGLSLSLFSVYICVVVYIRYIYMYIAYIKRTSCGILLYYFFTSCPFSPSFLIVVVVVGCCFSSLLPFNPILHLSSVFYWAITALSLHGCLEMMSGLTSDCGCMQDAVTEHSSISPLPFSLSLSLPLSLSSS